MLNKDYWTREEVMDAYRRWVEANKSNCDMRYSETPTAEEIVAWLYDPASTALALKPGTLVQVRTNLHGEGSTVKYGIVTKYKYRTMYSGMPHYGEVEIRYNSSEAYFMPVTERPLPASADPNSLGHGRIKYADVPQELVGLIAPKCGIDLGPVKEKCPFRDEWKTPVPPCMKEEDDE